ncbi:transient receptor potential cation channel subfamily V member 4-like [Haliotis rubra]|uniref:transient receptor potential cation channel subfamily V member 4-like n=1 Tax=Haliotis rubra TaxID=36100 RepID=UPI001EE62838|nr:transient receptor potential cation channel subfamily V member 4-like [Haliotis rubra]
MREVLSDWKVFERFVEKIVSRRVTDTECLDYYKNEVNNKKEKDTTGTIRYYRYRRMEEDREGSKEYTDRHEGEEFEELWGHTVLHLVVCANKTKTATAILEDTQDLIDTDIGAWPDTRDAYKGLTPFLIAVAQGNDLLVKLMLEKVSKKQCDWIGKRMNGTVFMGQLPFHTAVLCYMNDSNKYDTYREPENRFVKIMELLAEKADVFKEQNYRGDTVLHSIMRFVNCFPACEERTVDMMSYLESLMEKTARDAGEDVIDYKKKLFFTQNKNHMTALQLATESGHIKLFAYLFKVKGVYLIEHPHDELYEIRRFDVTEMDKIALIEAQKPLSVEAQKPPPPTDKMGSDDKKVYPGYKQTHSPGSTDARSNDVERDKGSGQPRVENGSFANNFVAELLCCQRLPVATELVRGDVFEEMVRRKMDAYGCPLLFLGLFHVSLICLLCVYVVARAGVTEGIYWPSGFLEFCNILTFVCSILYFVQEFPLRVWFAKQPFAWTAVHHNVVYRVTFVLFATFLFADFIFYRIPNSLFADYKSTFLVLAIIVGTWPILFFLRLFRRFSVYVVLLNEALFTAVVPFAVLILMQVFVFTACMHASFLHNEANATVVDDFSDYGMSLLTMGKLMVGLTEIDQLLKSREDGIILFLFALFILIIFLLMINALIGVMTNRFQDTQTNNEMVWRLQKLSVIIFIEGWYSELTSKLPNRFPRLGVDPEVSIGENTDEGIQSAAGGYSQKRFVMSYRKVRSNTADYPANTEHILRKQVKKSEELNTKMDRLLDFQESESYDGTRALRIYHYQY